MRGALQHHANPERDRAKALPALACPESSSVCESTAVGFPKGMCSGPCAPGIPGCEQFAIPHAFNQCLAQGQPFAQCLQHTRPGQRQTCSATQAGRGDDLCTRAAASSPGGTGLCMPPCFLFQMRVNGHP